jgi:hypothetical protein
MLHWCIPSQKNNTSKNLLITLVLHLSAGGIFRSMSILRAIIASMPSFSQYFFCYLGDQTSTAVAGVEASQNTGYGFWIDASGNLKRFYSSFCGQYLCCHCYFSSLGVPCHIFCFIVGRKSAGSPGEH